MAASAVYILDLKGKVLISRNYRGDMPLNIIEKFPKMLMEAEEEGTVTPVMTEDNVTFIHIKCNNIYVVCTTSGNFQNEKKNFQEWDFSKFSSLSKNYEIFRKLWGFQKSWIQQKYFSQKSSKIFLFWLFSGNSNVMCLVSFMHKLCEVFAEYFKEVEEESIRDNFVIVYELMDEVMDWVRE